MSAPGPRVVPILGCDGFLLALDGMMRRGGQGSHVSQSILELTGRPDVAAVTQGWRAFIQAHPIGVARLGRSWKNLLPAWRLPDPVRDEQIPPIGGWHEPGAAPLTPDSQPIDSLAELCRRRVDPPGRGGKRPEHWVRLDLLARADGSAAVLATWSHLLLDGKGVEILLSEVSRLSGDRAADAPAAPSALPPKPGGGWREKLERNKKFILHFEKVMTTRFSSLGGNKAVPGAIHYRVLALGPEDSARVAQRAAALSSKLINTPFYFACAARAHDLIFKQRGRPQEAQLITMPVQIRPKGAGGPIFQNYVSILFFRLLPDDLVSVEAATRSIQTQFAQMMRHRLDLSFSAMQDTLRWLPPRPYMGFLRVQMHGEITSFFHSHTGPFAPGLTHLGGAAVAHAYHLPNISTPPGTGLFVNEFGPRLYLQMSWRQGALSPDEQRAMFEAFLHDLLDGPATQPRWLLEV